MTVLYGDSYTYISGTPGGGNKYSRFREFEAFYDEFETIFRNYIPVPGISAPVVNTDPVYVWSYATASTMLGKQISGFVTTGTTGLASTTFLVGKNLSYTRTESASDFFLSSPLAQLRPFFYISGPGDGHDVNITTSVTGSVVTGTSPTTLGAANERTFTNALKIGSRVTNYESGGFEDSFSLTVSYESFFGGASNSNFGPFNMSCGDLEGWRMVRSKFERIINNENGIAFRVSTLGESEIYLDPIVASITASIPSSRQGALVHIPYSYYIGA